MAAPTPTTTAATSPPAAPAPRRTAPIVEIGPLVLGTDPRTNGINAPRDATIHGDLHRAGRRGRRVVRHHLRRERTAQQRDDRRRRPGPLHHAERQLRGRRAVHGHALQGPGDGSGPGRRRAEHRHAAGELRLVVHGRDRHRASVPGERPSDDGQPERRDRQPRPAEQLPDGEAGVRAVVQPGPRPPELGELAPVRRMDRHADARRHVPPRSCGAGRLVSRAVVRLHRQRIRSRPHGAERGPRQGDVDPDQPGDVPDDEHAGAGARQQSGPVGGARELPAGPCCPPRRSTSSPVAPAPAARAATAA